ncbi:hypothetical protein [Gallaecimonas mangrovi]|uniref:hypothetical protein n=1 Tax=Gallaecimonas mangrovi TaxID=2291597 RepID=UPI000E200BC8|nr:hypothetical protein [Gallaecimonas mangrovi]
MKAFVYGAVVAVVALVAIFGHAYYKSHQDGAAANAGTMTQDKSIHETKRPDDAWKGRSVNRDGRPTSDVRGLSDQAAKTAPATSAKTDNNENAAGDNRNDLPQLDNLVSTNKDGDKVFDTRPLKTMSLGQLEDAIAALTFSQTNKTAQNNESLLNSLLADKATSEGLFAENIGCSDKLCGLVISGESRSAVTKALDAISASDALQKVVKGGLKTVVEKDGRYFGSLLGVEVAKPADKVLIK